MYTSNTVTISGLPHPTPISLDQGALLINGKEMIEPEATVKNGDQVAVKLISNIAYEKQVKANIEIGILIRNFAITTLLNPWQLKSSYPGKSVSGYAGFSIDNKLYIGTGDGEEYYKEFYEYNPQTDIWTKKTDFEGEGRSMAASFAIGNKGYIGMGVTTKHLTDFWEYDPKTDKWQRIADFPAKGRRMLTSVATSEYGFVGLGYDDSQVEYKDLWRYNPMDNSWGRMVDFGGSNRFDAGAFIVDNTIYVGLGRNTNTNDLWKYDIQSNSWTLVAVLSETKPTSSKGISVQNYGYLTGYYNNLSKETNYLPSRYDPNRNSWNIVEGPEMLKINDPKIYLSNGDKIYVIAGGKFWEFTPPQE